MSLNNIISLVWPFLLLAVLLFFSAFFSGSETALFSLNPLRLKKIVGDKVPGSKSVAALLADPARLLATILIGNMLVNISATTLGTFITERYLPPEWDLLTILVMTYLILIFGEITPKTLASDQASRISLAVAWPLEALAKFFLPVRQLLRLLTDLCRRFLPARAQAADWRASRDEIRTALMLGAEEGFLDPQERELIEGAWRLGERSVREIMRPRPDIVALEVGAGWDEVSRTLAERPFSRYPVYDRHLENVVGLVHVKQFLRRPAGAPFSLRGFLQPAFFVPEAKNAAELFEEFKQGKNHLALVVDEHGALAGLVTLDDLLAEIGGPAAGPARQQPDSWQVGDRTVAVAARLSLTEFNKIFGTALSDQDCLTIGGWLSKQLGCIPKQMDSYDHGGFRFLVAKASPRRAEEIWVSLWK